MLHYDVSTACVTLEFEGAQIMADVSNLLSTQLEFGEITIKVRIGEVVNVIGYVEETDHTEQGLVIRAIMYWSPGRMSRKMLLNYGKIVAARYELMVQTAMQVESA